MLVVRFYVGTKEEDAIVKTYNKLYSNFDRIPAGRFAAAHQGALHRRRAHHGADAVGQELRQLQAAANRG